MGDRTGYLPTLSTTVAEQDALAPHDPASASAAGDVLLSGGTTGNLTSLAVRAIGRAVDVSNGSRGYTPKPAQLSAEDATARYGIAGELKFDHPLGEDEAAFRHDQKQDELGRRDILQRSPLNPLQSLSAGLVGGFIDPAGLALTFVPVVGEGRIAAGIGLAAHGLEATRGAALARGVVEGALGGLQGSAIGEAATYGLAHGAEGRDYTAQDAAMGLTVGTLLGTGFHATGAAIGWRPPPVRVTPGSQVDAVFGRIVGLGERSRQNQVSPKGAFGRAQLMEGTARDMSQALGIPWDPARARTDETYNLQLGREKVRQLMRRYGDDEMLVAAAYNAGEGRVDQWLARLGDPRTGAVSHADWAAGIPFRETRDYVARVGLGPNGAPHAPAPDTQVGGFDPVPTAVRALDEDARGGALVKAVDDLAQDRPVDVAGLMEREHQTGGGPRPELDDLEDARRIAGRFGEADTAVTVRGSEIPVRFAVVEARDLVTSHDDALVRNPEFPEVLQPRNRERAGSQARLHTVEAEFNPRRLMTDAAAEGGAPIVSPAGLVESGNGRVIVLRRNAEKDNKLYASYRSELERRGFDISGMSQPVLVRVRTEPLSGAERVRLSREMNDDTSERLGDTEQAFVDAEALGPADMALHRGGDLAHSDNREFLRRFVERAAGSQQNAVVDPKSRGLTQVGERRVRAALLAKAYGDRDLVYAVHETTDTNLKGVAAALGDAAPAWAEMRAAAGRGELSTGVDPTEALTSAVGLIRLARDGKLNLAELVAERRDQAGLFGEDALTPVTEAFIRLFYRDEALRLPAAAERVGGQLEEYARRALQTQAGPTLFGADDVLSPAEILASVARKWRDDPDGAGARRAALEPAAADAPPGGDLLQPGDDGRDGRGRGLQPQGGDGAAAQGGGVRAARDGAAGQAEPEGALARLSGEEIAPADTPRRQLAATIKAWFDTHLRGKSLFSEALDGEVRFSRQGRDHALGARRSEDDFRLTAALPEVVAKGRLAETAAPRDAAAEPTVRAYHYLQGVVELAGRRTELRVVVRETPHGHFHYDHYEVRESPAQPTPALHPQPSQARAGNGTSEGEAAAEMSAAARAVKAAMADPELRELAASTEALQAEVDQLREGGRLDAPDPAAAAPRDPETVAEAIRAAAFCLSEGGA